LHAGEAFGEFTLFTDMPRMHDADAVGNTMLAVILQERFELLLSNEPTLRRFIIGFLARRLLAVLELLEDERRLPLAMRLAKLLVRSPGSVADPMIITTTQTALAEELAVSRVALGEALKKLKTLGYVQLGYGRVKIIDNNGLALWIQTESQLVPLTSGA
jgi:CRP/FNR family transcriptional regulator